MDDNKDDDDEQSEGDDISSSRNDDIDKTRGRVQTKSILRTRVPSLLVVVMMTQRGHVLKVLIIFAFNNPYLHVNFVI